MHSTARRHGSKNGSLAEYMKAQSLLAQGMFRGDYPAPATLMTLVPWEKDMMTLHVLEADRVCAREAART